VNVGERIKNRRLEENISVNFIAKKLGVDRSTVYRYESADIEKFPIQIIEPLAIILNTTPSYLMGWSDFKENTSKKSKYTYIPTAISAGIPLEIDALVENDLKEIEIPDNLMGKWAGRKSIYITKISGESMNNVIPDGSVIAVIKTTIDCLKDGDIVVFSDEYEYSVKRFYKRDDKLVFRPDSTDKDFYDHVTNNKNENLIIYGKVVLYLVELN